MIAKIRDNRVLQGNTRIQWCSADRVWEPLTGVKVALVSTYGVDKDTQWLNEL